MFDLDFEGPGLRFPCHPRHAEAAALIKAKLADRLTDHFLLFSSGTTSADLKGYALSRMALMANARSVNEHFTLTPEDVWGLSLPSFHVGGLSVLARAHALKSKVVDLGTWDPVRWHQLLHEVSITTVVPTQVHDLVQRGLQSPTRLKYLIVGGDYLSLELEARAVDLGWPVIRTFGMTEVCSQLATSKSPGAPLEVLSIHSVKTKAQRLHVKSEALFTLQFKLKEELELVFAEDLCDEDGYYVTNDLAILEGSTLNPQGRSDDQIKVSGKLVSMNSLRETLDSYTLRNDLYGKAELALENDDRLGKRLVLLTLPGVLIPGDLFDPLRPEVREVETFERTDLGKLKQFPTKVR